ncbi:Uncharacterized conserved protein [Colwellia chukchiensis]|uniref:Uncharacterized conserved protein n=1 Tax=Colwellia chukchiensis TaxID=641665 RepID=A0A1H7NCF2_9GAMM|nr:DUF411 domain-containing protein [Colwellia chukchiensis]SEL20981.1 Uncharacterized conserved protein [Colwellia chukchiensis]
MIFKNFLLKFTVIFFACLTLASCSENGNNVANRDNGTVKSQPIELAVYKSPNCGCCVKWLDHIHEHGFASKVHDFQDVTGIKEQQGIAPRYRSCHTAVSADGYAFEGHVPAKFMHKFLQESHGNDVIGLSVPAMPVGTPGMEVDDKFQPYRILLLKADGSYQIYAHIKSYQEQF